MANSTESMTLAGSVQLSYCATRNSHAIATAASTIHTAWLPVCCSCHEMPLQA